MATSSQHNSHSHSALQTYGWRTFCFEFLCGTFAVAWYVLFLAEKTALRGLTRLEKLATARSDCGVGDVLFHDE